MPPHLCFKCEQEAKRRVRHVLEPTYGSAANGDVQFLAASDDSAAHGDLHSSVATVPAISNAALSSPTSAGRRWSSVADVSALQLHATEGCRILAQQEPAPARTGTAVT